MPLVKELNFFKLAGIIHPLNLVESFNCNTLISCFSFCYSPGLIIVHFPLSSSLLTRSTLSLIVHVMSGVANGRMILLAEGDHGHPMLLAASLATLAGCKAPSIPKELNYGCGAKKALEARKKAAEFWPYLRME